MYANINFLKNRINLLAKVKNNKNILKSRIMGNQKANTGEKFIYSQSYKDFKYETVLELNIISQIENRRFKCIRCNKYFIKKDNLINHLKLCRKEINDCLVY